MKQEPKITAIDIHQVEAKNGLIGFANFLIDGAFAVNGVAIYTRPNSKGIRLVFPVRKLKNGKEVSLIHPISWEAGAKLEQIILLKLQEIKTLDAI